MTSASSLLERELLGSARSIIDANSNVPFTQSHNTYRTPYGITNPISYTTPITSCHYLGYGNTSTDNYESKKTINDVNILLILTSYLINIF